jgi:DNA-binding IclR family transcriptional regulator
LAILERLARNPEPMGFSRISKDLGLNAATTARLLRTLIGRGYLVKTEAGAYRLGEAAQRLGSPGAMPDRLKQAAEPTVRMLRQASGNTAIAFWWSGGHTVCQTKAIHDDAPAMQPIGRVSTSLLGGPWLQIALAESSLQRRAELAEAYQVDPEALEAAARDGREQLDRLGCVMDLGGFRPHIRRLAAPIWGPERTLAGMLGLGGTLATMPDQRLSPIGRQLVEAARTMSLMLGASPTQADSSRTEQPPSDEPTPETRR